MMGRAMILDGLVKVALVSMLACGVDEDPMPPPVTLFDPTGTWDMIGTWGAGSCGATGTFSQPLVVSKSGDRFLATTGVASETTTGTVARDDSGADIDLTIVNSDVQQDGGSTQGNVPLEASTDASLRILGSGSVALSGAVTCSQQFTLGGTLRR